jgi:hypothetical protein
VSLLSYFLFASPKRNNKEKGDFFPKAPPEKRDPTLLTHRAIGLGGAGFLPMACYYWAVGFGLGSWFCGRLWDGHLRHKKAPLSSRLHVSYRPFPVAGI